MGENIEPEVSSSEVDLSSFKKRDTLPPGIWKDEETLDSRVRLKLLDIADDFWEFINLSWVEPKGIIKVELPCEEDEQEILKSMSLVLVLSDGTLMEIEFEVVDGKIVFETDAVGTIAFVDASLLKNQE